MLTTQVEKFADTFEEMLTCNLQHYIEISEHFKHNVPLEPDYPRYLTAEENGELLFITLRENGVLIGYFIGFVVPGLHYVSCITMVMDILFVTPDARGQKGGKMLMSMVDRECLSRSVRLQLTNFKEEHKEYMEKLLNECGYSPFERIRAKWNF